MRELYQKHQELPEAIKQLEVVRRTTDEVLKMNLTASEKEINYIFVSNLSSSVISKFTKTGGFVKSTSIEGENVIQLKSPKGISEVHYEYL